MPNKHQIRTLSLQIAEAQRQLESATTQAERVCLEQTIRDVSARIRFLQDPCLDCGSELHGTGSFSCNVSNWEPVE